LDPISKITAIQAELKERRQKVKELENKTNFDWNADWEKLQEENRKLLTWYKKEMAPFESIKEETLQKFRTERICYHNECEDLETQVRHGYMKEEELNLYKKWDRDCLHTLVDFKFISYGDTDFSDILKNYD
jgi:hypothetical protein